MMWMCVWMSPFCITDRLVGQAFRKHLESWVFPEGQTIAKCDCWAIQDGSHFIVKIIKMFPKPLIMLMCICESLSLYCYYQQPSFWNLPRILCTNNGIVLLLRLKTHLKWLPHHCQTHIRFFTTFICCGCTYGWVLITVLLVSPNKPFGSLGLVGIARGANNSVLLVCLLRL